MLERQPLRSTLFHAAITISAFLGNYYVSLFWAGDINADVLMTLAIEYTKIRIGHDQAGLWERVEPELLFDAAQRGEWF